MTPQDGAGQPSPCGSAARRPVRLRLTAAPTQLTPPAATPPQSAYRTPVDRIAANHRAQVRVADTGLWTFSSPSRGGRGTVRSYRRCGSTAGAVVPPGRPRFRPGDL